MRVFVTGASGFIGSAIVKELISAGHQVLGLARSEESAEKLIAAGAGVHMGTLENVESLKRGAAAADGVIHTAFIHDFKDIAAAGRTDAEAIAAMGEALEGTGKALVVTSGVAHLIPGQVSTEEDAPNPNAAAKHRIPSEEVTLALAARGVRSSIIRLSPSVHGEGDYGFVPMLINIARQKGVSVYVGDGLNRWPAVHRLDAARLFRLAVEKGVAGSCYHGVAEQGIACREIAEAIGRQLNIPVVSKTHQEAMEHFGWLGNFFAIDCPASSQLTQHQLNWHPTHPGLIADLDMGHYFKQ